LSDFVKVVGYQFERVHTGVISWLLDSSTKTVSINDKYEVLKNLYRAAGKDISFKVTDISVINCFKEYSFGRKLKIDLVIEIELANQEKKYWVIEMKVDSIPNEDQLSQTLSRFSQDHAGVEVNYCLFLLGASQVTTLPENLHGFVALTLDDIFSIFANLSINHYLYKDWINALLEEQKRRDDVIGYLSNAKDIWDKEYFEKLGYRTWFPLTYYIFYHLKNELQFTKYNKWNIYSGANNPVLNWEDGWRSSSIKNVKIEYYWEFNYYDLCLKIYVEDPKALSRDDLAALRGSLYVICEKTSHPGYRTKNTVGEYITIFKWHFDFIKISTKDVAQHVESIITHVHSHL